MTEIKIPAVGESIAQVEIGAWLKNEGDSVAKDENLVVIESDKATLELAAPAAGVVSQIRRRAGETAAVGEVIGIIEAGKQGDGPPKEKKGDSPLSGRDSKGDSPQVARGTVPDRSAPQRETRASPRPIIIGAITDDGNGAAPARGKELAEQGDSRQREQGNSRELQRDEGDSPQAGREQGDSPQAGRGTVPLERAVPLSPLRRAVAKRLVQAKQEAALLTTFNEIDMSEVKALREQERARFEERHGVRLGYMSFFVKAAVAGLQLVPQLNGELRDDALVYYDEVNIGIAVGSGKGLVVPVLRRAEKLSFAEIEKQIADFARRAEENRLKPQDFENGTFTISNGGIYGSLLSTPIVNPPQSGILGMHAIIDRPIARGGAVVIRPMMYVALTYDHRIIDGREAVQFLRRVKECVEAPARLLLDS